MFDIRFVGRPKQQYPTGDWSTWIVQPGRGFGKTFLGSHWVNDAARNNPKCRIAIIGQTAADVRDVMVNGDSGIISRAYPKFRPLYNPSNRIITWPNGSIAQTYSGDEPEQLRGPQFHKAWVDELFKFKNQDEMWDMLQFCMRLGTNPQVLITSTPRPTPLCNRLVSLPSSVVTTGSTFENSSNLAPQFIEAIKQQYDGTRLGQQELYGAILNDNPRALFKFTDIDKARLTSKTFRQITKGQDGTATAKDVAWLDEMDRVVVAIDPPKTSEEDSDECGLVVAGRKGDEGYVFADESFIASPNQWAKKAVELFRSYKADLIIGEANNGGDMIEALVMGVDRNVKYKKVTATRGKAIRAEPIAGLYEQHRIHHVGTFGKLEAQMTEFDPALQSTKTRKDDRLDAVVWAFAELFDLGHKTPQIVFL